MSMRTEPRGARVYNFISTNNSKHSSPILNPSNPKNSKPRTRGHFSTPCGRYGSSEIAICLYTLYIYIPERVRAAARSISKIIGDPSRDIPTDRRVSLRSSPRRVSRYMARLSLSSWKEASFVSSLSTLRTCAPSFYYFLRARQGWGQPWTREREIRFHAAALSRRVFTFDRQRLFSFG